MQKGTLEKIAGLAIRSFVVVRGEGGALTADSDEIARRRRGESGQGGPGERGEPLGVLW